MNGSLQPKQKRLMNRKSLVLILSVVLVSLCAVSIAVLATNSQAPSASGSGQLGTKIITFSAVKHINDQRGPQITGIAQQHDLMTDMKLTLDVNCIRVHGDGITATIGGSVLRTTGMETGEFVFEVKDNGEGGNVIDELNTFHLPDFGDPCEDSVPTMPSDRGNIQVRGGN